MFTIIFFWGGDPVPIGVCASKPWSISSASKNLRGSTPKGLNVISRKSPLRCVNGSRAPIIFLFVDQSSSNSFRPTANVEEVVVDRILFRFSIRFSIRSEDIRDQSRMSEIAPNFLPSQILGSGLPKVTHVITPASRHVAWKSIVRILSLAPKL